MVTLGVALALSLGLHALLTLWRAHEEIVAESPPIEVVPAPPPPARSATPAKRKGRAGRAPIPASKLALVAPGDGPMIGAFRAGGGSGESVAGDSPEQAMRDTGTYANLFELVDQALDYPAALTDHDEEGTVKARLVFTPDGKFNRDRSSIQGASNFLRVHVIRTLNRAFAGGIGPRPTTLIVRCSFEFRIRSGPLARRQVIGITDTAPGLAGAQTIARENLRPPASHSSIPGSYLHFYREHNTWSALYVDTTVDDRNQKNTTAARVDLMPLVEKGLDAIGDLFSPKAKRDPLDNYREDPEWATSR